MFFDTDKDFVIVYTLGKAGKNLHTVHIVEEGAGVPKLFNQREAHARARDLAIKEQEKGLGGNSHKWFYVARLEKGFHFKPTTSYTMEEDELKY